MNKFELDDVLSNTISYNDDFTSYDLLKLNEKIQVDLEMDRDNMLYFYGIDYDRLLSSDLNRNDITDLFMKGWEYNKNEKKLIRKI
jgi:hypothetical protein